MANAAVDRDRPSDEVVVGERWFVWGHHHTIEAERSGHLGVREVRVKMDKSSGQPRPKSYWIPAWRVQRFGGKTGV